MSHENSAEPSITDRRAGDRRQGDRRGKTRMIESDRRVQQRRSGYDRRAVTRISY
jgi:hypothetical protein